MAVWADRAEDAALREEPVGMPPAPEYFPAIVDHGGFNRAALALYVSQPAMSQPRLCE